MHGLRVAGTLMALMLACGSSVRQARRDLDSPNPSVRMAALRILAKAGDMQCVPDVVVLLGDAGPDVRKQAARTLGKIGDERAISPLADLYETEPDDDVAAAAVRALVRIGRASVETLIGLAGSRRPSIRRGAILALGKLRASTAVDVAIWRLKDVDPSVRIAAIHALRAIGDARGMEAIAATAEDGDEDVERAAERALGGRGYQDQLDRARRTARRHLGR
jgi:HEAT repeat protein